MTDKDPIAIIGPGRVGAPLGRRLGKAGWPIVYGARTLDRVGLAEIVADSGPGARLLRPEAAALEARIILFAVPWISARGSLASLGDLTGKVIIDTTNPLRYENGLEFEVDVPHSAAELIQEWAPGASVVKAFNTTNFRIMADPSVVDGPITIPVAGDDALAKALAAKLVADAGFHVVDAGPLANAHYLEKMAAFYISFFFQDRPDAVEFYLRPRPTNSILFKDRVTSS
jgi:predicted dinucleotide-binding enzyme